MTDDIRFVRRVRRLRTWGLGVGFLCVGMVFHENHTGPIPWLLATLHAFIWPQVAYWLAMSHQNPKFAEYINLGVDSAMGGVWVALMQFNLLPSVLLISMLAADKLNVGGWRLLLRTLPGQVIACVFAAALNGFQIRTASSPIEILACVPFLLIYPSAISLSAHGLARRVMQQNLMLREIGRTDMLTGLASRTHWSDLAYAELKTARSRGHSSVMLMLDIDHFKSINDHGGHAAGDEVLRQFANLLKQSVRGIDTAARFAGDEFVVLLPGANAEIAAHIAERIRLRTATIRSGGIECSVSVGIAMLEGWMPSAEAWVDAADQALYLAKSRGRNRVMTYDHEYQFVEPVV
ncbi:sensor domain-containing diguanylate cyclase [Dyella sp. GSA-30]|uniref:sensor domain-containing diguanylate cyclase n=1 Tax=Dyella sp. GSA-30 TaxID=2994496 RepID=UPI0024920352|nr:sensor domain-containing diguanylate cyclase [Dyella sp. GSA-30]BDU23150.1 diguanylate cyclase AdrA [Dyella sp. GSA-30]